MREKLEGQELAQYWSTLLDRRMPEEDEVNRLICVLKGQYLSHVKHYEIPLPATSEALLAGLLDFQGEKRPYGNKDVPASIAYQLGWDYKRQLCYHAMPEEAEKEAERLHEAVYKELQENGWLHA